MRGETAWAGKRFVKHGSVASVAQNLEPQMHTEHTDAAGLNYLKATDLELCLLLNFGKPRLQIKRLIL